MDVSDWIASMALAVSVLSAGYGWRNRRRLQRAESVVDVVVTLRKLRDATTGAIPYPSDLRTDHICHALNELYELMPAILDKELAAQVDLIWSHPAFIAMGKTSWAPPREVDWTMAQSDIREAILMAQYLRRGTYP